MTSVTDEHRKILAEEFTSRGFDTQATMAINGELDYHPNMQLITRCHQAGMIEGARLYQLHCMYTWMDDDEDYQGCDFADWVGKTDPAAIVKGKSDGID